MAITLLTTVKKILVSLGLNSNVTTFQESDETLTIVQFVNEAFIELINELPPISPMFNVQDQITTVAGTRTYTAPTDFFAPNLSAWSIENETLEDGRLNLTTLEYLRQTDSKYDEVQGIPNAIYIDGQNIAVYPVPNDAYIIKFGYTTGTPTELTATTDIFPVPDKWVYAIRKMAQAYYEDWKGYATAETCMAKARYLYEDVVVDAWDVDNTYIGG